MKSNKSKSKMKRGNNNNNSSSQSKDKDKVEEGEDDATLLQRPKRISVSNVMDISKLLVNGSEEVKEILTYECDVIYECRVCRSLFRSLVNFISHKRVYCREKFNVTLDKEMFKHGNTLEMAMSESNENLAIERSVKKVGNNNNKGTQSSKDLSSIVEMLQSKQKYPTSDCEQVLLESIDSNRTARFQTVFNRTSSPFRNANLMKSQVVDLYDALNEKTAILSANGQIVDCNNSSDIEDALDADGIPDDDVLFRQSFACSICNASFSSKKTLSFHMKTLHALDKMCYPCPCCNITFFNTWSVYRHLYKVHKKTNEQVRKLRAQIQMKAYRKETDTPENQTTTPLVNANEKRQPTGADITKEWMEHLESDLELQRCGGCGRRFDRLAALKSHTQSCQQRIAACNESVSRSKTQQSPKESKESSVAASEPVKPIVNGESRRSTGKANLENQARKKLWINDSTPVADELLQNNVNDSRKCGKANRVQDTLLMNPTVLLNRQFTEVTVSRVKNRLSLDSPKKRSREFASDESDDPEIVYTNINQSSAEELSIFKKQKIAENGNLTDDKHKTGGKQRRSPSTASSSNKSTASRDSKNSKMDNKIASIVNFRRLMCLKCQRKFSSLTNLRRHMAIHIGWNRYKCKLCDFKCFVKCDCVAHCNRMHNARNNRAIIAEMITQISQHEFRAKQNIVMDMTSMESPPESDSGEGTRNNSDSASNNESDDDGQASENKTSVTEETEMTDNANDKDEELLASDEDLDESAEPEDRPVNEKDWHVDSGNEMMEIDEEEGASAKMLLETQKPNYEMIMEVIFGSANSAESSARAEEQVALKEEMSESEKADSPQDCENSMDDNSESLGAGEESKPSAQESTAVYGPNEMSPLPVEVDSSQVIAVETSTSESADALPQAESSTDDKPEEANEPLEQVIGDVDGQTISQRVESEKPTTLQVETHSSRINVVESLLRELVIQVDEKMASSRPLAKQDAPSLPSVSAKARGAVESPQPQASGSRDKLAPSTTLVDGAGRKRRLTTKEFIAALVARHKRRKAAALKESMGCNSKAKNGLEVASSSSSEIKLKRESSEQNPNTVGAKSLATHTEATKPSAAAAPLESNVCNSKVKNGLQVASSSSSEAKLEQSSVADKSSTVKVKTKKIRDKSKSTASPADKDKAINKACSSKKRDKIATKEQANESKLTTAGNSTMGKEQQSAPVGCERDNGVKKKLSPGPLSITLKRVRETNLEGSNGQKNSGTEWQLASSSSSSRRSSVEESSAQETVIQVEEREILSSAKETTTDSIEVKKEPSRENSPLHEGEQAAKTPTEPQRRKSRVKSSDIETAVSSRAIEKIGQASSSQCPLKEEPVEIKNESLQDSPSSRNDSKDPEGKVTNWQSKEDNKFDEYVQEEMFADVAPTSLVDGLNDDAIDKAKLNKKETQCEESSLKSGESSNSSSPEKLDVKKSDLSSSACSDYSSDSGTLDKDKRPQRPVRNRVKPVDKDFIYDLKDVQFRKECIVFKNAPKSAAGKKNNDAVAQEQPSKSGRAVKSEDEYDYTLHDE